jgi:hypothetical protein
MAALDMLMRWYGDLRKRAILKAKNMLIDEGVLPRRALAMFMPATPGSTIWWCTGNPSDSS